MSKMAPLFFALALLTSALNCQVDAEFTKVRGNSLEDETGVAPAGKSMNPWQVSIERIDEDGYFHWCSGLLIHPSKVLTAGTCFFNYSNAEFRVIGGKYELSVNGTEDEEQTRAVAEIKMHPNFTRTPLDYDLAVMIVEEPFEVSRTVSPYPLPLPREGDLVERGCATVGWLLDPFLPGHELELQQGPIELMDKVDCARNLTEKYTERFLCSHRIRYQVDFGGPLFCGSNDNKTLEGLTSLQFQGDLWEHPIQFSDIQYALRWLNASDF